MTRTSTPFTAHQRLRALDRLAAHPNLADGERRAMAGIWTDIWDHQAAGNLLWADHFERGSWEKGYLGDRHPGIRLEVLVDAWRALADLDPIDRRSIEEPTNDHNLPSSVLVPASAMASTVAVGAPLLWFPPLGDRSGVLVATVRRR